MISCPICTHEQMVGTVFCGNCGNQLVPEEKPNQVDRAKIDIKEPIDSPSSIEDSKKPKKSWVSLNFLDTGEILPLPEKDELTIGRCSEDQPILPDIDLSLNNAYENGVSRLHCVIKRVKTKTYIKDLGSSNGTTLNGSRLNANSDTPFKHGDILSLGKLSFKLILHQE